MTPKMEDIISLCKRRGFIFPGSEIYGGLANSWDFGPLGVLMKKNIKDEWWRRFVTLRDDVVGLESALIMNPKVWESSGHLKVFTDPLSDCKKCKERFRSDKLISSTTCPNCGGELSEPRMFNLMLKTFLGPVENNSSIVYFRPETAQGMFVDFKEVQSTSRKKIPFGIAQIGKSFRNEITPGNFIFRTREFEQMEIEYFIEENDWQKFFEHWLEEMRLWLKDLGLKKENIVYEEISEKDRAHYSKRTVDIMYQFPFGLGELYGLAYRGDFDLKNHGQDYFDQEKNTRYIPHVIEPTWGVERTLLATLVASYKEDKELDRTLLSLPTWLAPYKVAVLPLIKKEELTLLSKKVYKDLKRYFSTDYDETQSIGRRYRRQDEIGTPFCITIDFESTQNNDVTIRYRDTGEQKRLPITEIKSFIENEIQKSLSL